MSVLLGMGIARVRRLAGTPHLEWTILTTGGALLLGDTHHGVTGGNGHLVDHATKTMDATTEGGALRLQDHGLMMDMDHHRPVGQCTITTRTTDVLHHHHLLAVMVILTEAVTRMPDPEAHHVMEEAAVAVVMEAMTMEDILGVTGKSFSVLLLDHLFPP